MLPIALPTPTHPSSRPRSQSSAAPHYAAAPPAQLVELTPVRPKRALRRRLALCTECTTRRLQASTPPALVSVVAVAPLLRGMRARTGALVNSHNTP